LPFLSCNIGFQNSVDRCLITFPLIQQTIKIPVVLITGVGKESLAVETLKTGVYDYVIKDLKGSYLKRLPIIIPDMIKKYKNDMMWSRKNSHNVKQLCFL